MKRKIIQFVLIATFAFTAMAGLYACGSSSSSTTPAATTTTGTTTYTMSGASS